jgi:hypothetical protein
LIAYKEQKKKLKPRNQQSFYISALIPFSSIFSANNQPVKLLKNRKLKQTKASERRLD